MKLYSQRDSRWAELKLGESNLTMGRFGCTTTAISMLTTYFHPDRTPAEIIDKQNPYHIQYTKDGLIIWNTCRFENFTFYLRTQGRNDTEIQRHLKDPNLAVILEVADHSHWVLPVSYLPILGYKAADPWVGDYCNVLKRYKNITGAAYFRRK